MLGPWETDTADAPVKTALELSHSQHRRELGGRVAAEARVPAPQLQQAKAAFCVVRAARPVTLTLTLHAAWQVNLTPTWKPDAEAG